MKIGADALLQALKNQEVKQMFAFPGGAILPIYDRMPKYDIDRILVRNEQGASFGAQGISRLGDKVGVCLATSGPGATNLVTGIADAKMDNVPMVAITGNVFTHLIGSDAFQEIDIIGVCDPIVKHSFFVTEAEKIPEAIENAFTIAKEGRPGPVLVDITKTAQSDKISQETWEKLCRGESFSTRENKNEIQDISENLLTNMDKAIDLIAKSERPLIIAGNGIKIAEAKKQFKDFVEKTNIPVTWTLHGIGVINEEDCLGLGMLGMHGTCAANYATHNADLILGVGIRFDDRITGKLESFKSNKKFIHFDIDHSEFDKILKALPIEGCLQKTLPLINKKIEENSQENFPGKFKNWRNDLEARKEQWKLSKATSDKFTEITVIDQIFSKLSNDAIVLADVGQHEMWMAQRFPADTEKSFLASGGLGTMGFSLPTAMGACLSGRETWTFSGDGGFQMNLQELATIKQENLPLKIVILNNQFLGMVRQWQDLFYEKNYVDTPMDNPDFVALGKAFGIESYLATNEEESLLMIEKMKAATGPILVEFKVEKEENVWPMVPAGASLGETMISRGQKIEF